ncbi:MAG TPA: 50S ribosomal protein L24, partial [Candidatus Peregrinibacteria bacterium]|nr:50S ribosomal protein L24 [Candidatus Peregrinibacteria bacterium]
MMKIKVNDKVFVATGKDSGKVGKVTKILEKKGRLVVEKVNIVTKHVKKTANRSGERVKLEAPIDISNVKLICPRCSKAVRVGYHRLENNKKERICKKCSQVVDKEFKKIKK